MQAPFRWSTYQKIGNFNVATPEEGIFATTKPTIPIKEFFKPQSYSGGPAGKAVAGTITTALNAYPATAYTAPAMAGKLSFNLPSALKSSAAMTAFSAGLQKLQGEKPTLGGLVPAAAFGLVGGVQPKIKESEIATILGNRQKIESVLTRIKNYKSLKPQYQIQTLADAGQLLKQFVPGMATEKESLALYRRNPETWLNSVGVQLQEKLAMAVAPHKFGYGIKFGQSTEPIGGIKALKQAEQANFYNQARGEVSANLPARTPKAVLKGQLQFPSAVKATIKTTPQPQLKGILSEAGGGGQGSSGGIIPDLESQFREALSSAGLKRETQESIYKFQRAQRFARFAKIGEKTSGEAGAYKQLGQLGGQMRRVEFDTLRKSLNQGMIDALFEKGKGLATVGDQATYINGLRNLLGAEGGRVPTRSEIEVMSQVLEPATIQAILDKRPALQKILSMAESALNVPRAVMATADLSAPLRQGIFFVSRPKQWLPAFRDMFKYAFSEKAYTGLMDDIKTRPNYKLMRESRLALTDMGPNLMAREEQFMSNLVEKIPVFGKIARGSNRAYSGFLNKLRADVFDDLVESAGRQGIKIEGKRLADLASFINAATGRGNLNKTLEKVAPVLNGVFFSPRLMASRINLLNPAYYVRLDPFVRKEAIKSLLGTSAILGTILGLAKLGGAEVGGDSRSADFGKIKSGNTRYDILGGFQQYIRLASQLISGQIVSSTTGKTLTLGEGYKPLTRKDILMRFFENKTSPVASFVIGALNGKNSIGQDFNIPTEVINRFIPMMAQDIYDIAREKGSLLAGLAMGLPGVFGAGSQTYGGVELLQGQNKLGQPTSQVVGRLGLGEKISSKLFGQQPLGSTSSYNAEAYLDQLNAMPREQAKVKFDEIIKTNPELAKKINQVIKDRKKGVTVDDQVLKQKGVASGDRALTIKKEFDKLKTKQEKAALWDHYVKVGVITKEVAKQLKEIL
jgi:hypothetical protein